MKDRRKNPYEMLLEEFKEYANKVEHPKTKQMWRYTEDGLKKAWFLGNLLQRVMAAEQLGFDVMLKNNDGSLEVQYVEKRPVRPWRTR